MQKKAIENRADVENLVNTFYGRVQKDDLIGPIFNRVIENRWEEHLEKMYQFWETILFEETYTYRGRPFPKHIPLGLEEKHFNRWISIFNETLEDLFLDNEEYQKAKKQAQTMATLFLSKLEFFNQEGRKPIL